MYCRCSAAYADASPNTHVCPVCMGLPGVLPVINRRAIEFTMMTALALNCSVPEYTKFDRKNYPYPDLMKGYQISQFDAPIALGGYLDIEADGQTRRAGITRVHLEEDVAKLLHRTAPDGGNYSLVDINRAGSPLMEVVGEPDLRTPEEARQYLIRLRTILRYLGVSTGNMEEGSFRCDANISVRPVGSTELGGKVEVKNMNSFRAVFMALEYEAKRQRQRVADGKRLVQETRGWVESEGKTVSQRSKEFAHDYRYFPEPDLPPINISREWVEEVRAKLPELPEARKQRLMADYIFSDYEASLLTASREMAEYLETFIAEGAKGGYLAEETAKQGSNWLLGEVNRIMNANGIDIDEFKAKVSPEKLFELVEMVSKSSITGAAAKPVLAEMYATGREAGGIVTEKGLGQINDTSELEQAVAQVIESNQNPVEEYRAGKETVLKFLVGQVMKATKGRADPQAVAEIIRQKLA
ncbi:Asp-tRNA(Asn)/Glu-tRNA(Gln) amidotransferase subunit GatB [Chloroflexota bacterium]